MPKLAELEDLVNDLNHLAWESFSKSAYEEDPLFGFEWLNFELCATGSYNAIRIMDVCLWDDQDNHSRPKDGSPETIQDVRRHVLAELLKIQHAISRFLMPFSQ